MSITLCFDFGNTRLKYAVFEKDLLRSVELMKDDGEDSLRAVLENHRPRRTILSSVIDHNPRVDEILSAETHFHRLTNRSNTPVTTPVGKPETIGADRLALAAAASHFYPAFNNLVVTLGSAITFNYINRFHEFVGGSISPGMEMRFKSLELFTARLPLIGPHWNFPLMGYDTKTNIQSGVIIGIAKEIDGVIEAYEERYANLNVLMTGGDAAWFMPFMKKKVITDPDLIFKGLYVISEFN